MRLGSWKKRVDQKTGKCHKNAIKMHKKIKQKNIFQNRFLLVLIVLSASFFLWQEGDANSPSITELSSDSKNAQKKIEELEKRADIYREIINIKKKQSETLSDQLEVTTESIDQVQSQIDLSKQKIDDYNGQISRLEGQIKEKNEVIVSQKRILTDLVQAFYEVNQASPVVSYLNDGNIASFMVTKDRLAQTGDKINELVVSIKKIKEDLEKQSTEIDESKKEVVLAHEKLQNQNQDLESAKKQRETLLAQTKSDESKYQNLLKKTQEQIQEEIEQIESSKSGADLGPLPPSKSGLFAYPVNPVKITQGYGKTSFAVSSGIYKNNFHNGIDLGISYNNLFASMGGKVIDSGDNGNYAYGKWIAIDHGNGLVTMYGHLSKKYVTKGENVTVGQKIGITGNTGKSTGPHLHFTVFARKTFEVVESSIKPGLMLPTGASVNPMNYL